MWGNNRKKATAIILHILINSFHLFRYTTEQIQEVKDYLMEHVQAKFEDTMSPRRLRSEY